MKRMSAVVGLSTMLLTGAIAVAGPVAAAPEPLAEMPDVKGMTLARAQSVLYGLTDKRDMKAETFDMKGLRREQINEAGWTVCAQRPYPGNVIYKTSTLRLGVVRKYGESCYD